jgi:rhodanese-related sulfurtransferase
MIRNPNFIEQLEQVVNKDALLLFICRSGARSAAAAALAAQSGFVECYDVRQGFEGDKNSEHHRNVSNGWRAAGLPWVQT